MRADTPLASGLPSPARPHTKIVATLGPASDDRVTELILAGMSVARINFSHGSPTEHRRRVDRVRRQAAVLEAPIAILADLPGPKLRLGRFEGGQRPIEAGELLRVRQGEGIAPPGEVHVQIEGFLEALRPGHRLILADGLCVLRVEQRDGDSVLARVVRGGLLGDGKGVHLPDSPLPGALPTEKDLEWIGLARELGVEMLGLSFVSRAEEVRAIRALAPDALLVAKIERRAALENLDELLEASDGLMVARGDLGVELELEEVPMAQKALLQAALRAGRFTITATEMLESMVHSSRPTRAEVADVANAVLDGTDAVMLSAETAVGCHPVEAVQTMSRVAAAVERSQRYLDLPKVATRHPERDAPDAIAMAAVQAAEALRIERMVCFTESGRSVRLLSRYRPRAEIIALSPCERTVRQMAVLAHVRPLVFRREASLEDMLAAASSMLLERGLCARGEPIVFVAGVPPGVSRSTNLMQIHRVGEEIRLH